MNKRSIACHKYNGDTISYLQCCDERIANGYTAMSSEEEDRSVVTAKITAKEILLSTTDMQGWTVIFDKEPTKVR